MKAPEDGALQTLRVFSCPFVEFVSRRLLFSHRPKYFDRQAQIMPWVAKQHQNLQTVLSQLQCRLGRVYACLEITRFIHIPRPGPCICKICRFLRVAQNNSQVAFPAVTGKIPGNSNPEQRDSTTSPRSSKGAIQSSY